GSPDSSWVCSTSSALRSDGSRAPTIWPRRRRPRPRFSRLEVPEARATAERADVSDDADDHENQAEVMEPAELVLRERERQRRPWQDEEAEEWQEEGVERAAEVVGEQPEQEQREARTEERERDQYAAHAALSMPVVVPLWSRAPSMELRGFDPPTS